MFFHAVDRGNDLDVGGRAQLEVDAFADEMRNEIWIFVTARAVADALRIEGVQRLPDALRAQPFSGVSCAENAVVARVSVGADVGREWEARFVAGDVQRDDAAAAKFLDEARRLHTLRFGEMP